MQHFSIKLKPNRYMMLAWVITYGSMIGVIAHLPAGQWQYLGWIATALLAGYALFVHVLLLLPTVPKSLECTINPYGQVLLGIENELLGRWSFVWCTQRLVVLIIWHQPFLLWWLPRFGLWFSPHNTSKELHRNIRILARFGNYLPVHHTDIAATPESTAKSGKKKNP